MTDREGNEEKMRFWERKSGSESRYILIAFITMIVIMMIVVISMGAYGYYSWQEWKSGPKIRVQEGLFEFDEPTGDEANITVHLTVINNGEKKSGDIELEWLIMELDRADDNILFSRGSVSFEPVGPSQREEVQFNTTLGVGDYMLAYRVYDDGLFSYEARQSLEVTSSDVEQGEAKTEEVPEFPSLVIPVLSVLVLLIIYRKRYHGR